MTDRQILYTATVFLCIANFSAITSLVLKIDDAQSSESLPMYPTTKYKLFKKSKDTAMMDVKKFKPDITEKEKFELMVYLFVKKYFADSTKFLRSDVVDNKEVQRCEDECKKEVRMVCSYKSYTCTEYTLTHLGHSCYLQCHWHLTDPNPYREHLYQEKFRKGQKRTTTTELPHPSTRRATEVTFDEFLY